MFWQRLSSMKKIYLLILLIGIQNTSLAESFSMRCKFINGQSTQFESSLPKTKQVKDFPELIFDQIDTDKGTARLIGNIGAETIQAIKGERVINLYEITQIGNVNITTIFMSEDTQKNNIFPVVHSRHIALKSGPIPSQYVGTCLRIF